MPRKAEDLSGRRFGMWAVVRRGENIGHVAAFICRCDCGATSLVRGHSLRSGGSTGCGCARSKRLGDRARSHGKHNHHLYGTWVAMRDRCRRKNHDQFKNYGGRGITVCDRWADFESFLEDMEPSWRHGRTLDRIDNDGNYTPENCKWSTQSEQLSNQRPKRSITFNGETRALSDWARVVGIHPSTLNNRLARGWPLEVALTRGPQKGVKCQ